MAGSLLAFVAAALELRGGGGRAAYQRARQGVGRAILLGLEVLIIADMVLTITVDRTFDSAVTLGLIILLQLDLQGEAEERSDQGRCRGVAAPRTSGRTQPSASVTTRMSQAAGYRSWGGVPDACRQVRATRRSRSP